MALHLVPAHVNEATEPVDNLGGILSLVLVGGADPRPSTSRPCPTPATLALVLGGHRGRRGGRLRPAPAARREPALRPQRRRPAAPSGSRRAPASSSSARSWARCSSASSSCRTCSATRRSTRAWRSCPAAVFMVAGGAALGASSSSRAARASRCCSATSSACSASSRCCCCGRRASRTGRSALGYALRRRSASGFAGTPASHSLTGSVPVRRAGMASGTADLQRDLGGAIMQSIFGALLTAGYAAASPRRSPRRPTSRRSPAASQNQLDEVVHGAAAIAQQYPQYADADHRRRQDVVPAGRPVGLRGRDHRRRPRRRARLLLLSQEDEEEELLDGYQERDSQPGAP